MVGCVVLVCRMWRVWVVVAVLLGCGGWWVERVGVVVCGWWWVWLVVWWGGAVAVGQWLVVCGGGWGLCGR